MNGKYSQDEKGWEEKYGRYLNPLGMTTTVANSPTQLDDFITIPYLTQLTEIWPKTDKSKLPPRSQKVLGPIDHEPSIQKYLCFGLIDHFFFIGRCSRENLSAR